MKITDIRVIQKTMQLERPMRNSLSSSKERWFTFVLVETDAHLTGIGDPLVTRLSCHRLLKNGLRPWSSDVIRPT